MPKKKHTARILVADDEVDFRSMLQGILSGEGHTVVTAEDGSAAINALQEKTFDLALLDVRMPRVDGIEVLHFIKQQYIDTQVIMITGVNDVRMAVECMKNGAFYYVTKPYSIDELFSLVDRALDQKSLVIENKVMKSELSRLAQSSHLIGQSAEFIKVLELAGKVAPTDSIVLIEGASGTGKELFANLLHKNSPRVEKPFVALNCASIPDTLIESEMFGHEKGAFTDAQAMRQGLVEIANGGTLFLDEIGEVSPVFQPKLLRFIQTGEFRRIGGNKTLKSDVRIISATNKNLVEEVKAGKFREDLLYRLNVITLRLPSLQQRKDDIPVLIESILLRKNKTKQKRTLHPDALQSLMEYDWPGNIRELENVLERAMILCEDETIRPKDLALPQRMMGSVSSNGDGGGKIGSAITIDELEKDHIAGVLANTKWNKNLASKILGISLKTLYTKIQQYNLKQD
ncbi:MAG: sigma-54-dependent Fis family transcriptional regulator [Ignavibacteriales bacterium]|nr:sigma-54-dependent Fis family transcriptional regulator [Ignavibacteriales bacterium]